MEQKIKLKKKKNIKMGILEIQVHFYLVRTNYKKISFQRILI